MSAVEFQYIYRGTLHTCTYEVVTRMLVVHAGGTTRETALSRGDDPLRLARVLAHEIFNQAERGGQGSEPGGD